MSTVPDIFEKLTGVIKGLFAMAAKAVTGIIPPALASPVKGLSEDLRLAVMNEITSKDDLLFRKSRSLDESNFVAGKSEEYVISSNGTEYEITFTVTRKDGFN